MNSPWYESQLVGVVVGAILGFLLSFIPNRFVERRKVRVLSRALKAEADLIVREKAERIPIYENYLRTLDSGGPCSIYSSGRASDRVYQANTTSVGSLPGDLVTDLVAFYHKVEQFQIRIGAIESVVDRYNVGTDSNLDSHFIINTFKKTIKIMEEIVELGKKLSVRLESR